MRRSVIVATLVWTLGLPAAATAQQPLSEVLSFLRTNRSILTGDFARDEAAAAATRDTQVTFMLAELNTRQMAAGLRWNVATKWLLSMNVLRPLTTAGLNARWMTSVSLDYAVGN